MARNASLDAVEIACSAGSAYAGNKPSGVQFDPPRLVEESRTFTEVSTMHRSRIFRSPRQYSYQAWMSMMLCGALAGACSSSIDPAESMGRAAITEATTGCQMIPVAQRHAALLAMDADTDHPISCGHDDARCPCGSYCSIDNICVVECFTEVLSADPPNDLGCDANETCTPLGRCAASANTPPPSRLALTLAMSPLNISANTASGSVLIPVTVGVDANSLDFLQPEHPAVVKYHFVGIDDPRPSRIWVMARRATARRHDRAPALGCSGCGSRDRAG
jgi:hypothetical protein